MSLINCPECGREISDTCSSCPSCGYDFRRKRKSSSSSLKSGAIVNLVGSAGFLASFGLLSLVPQDVEQESADVELSVDFTPTTLQDGNFAGALILVFLVGLLIVTVLSLVILLSKDPKRKKMIPIAAAQLCVSLAENVTWVVLFNVLIVCCGLWVLTWGVTLQLIGSLLCMRGALKLDD